jgi:hypothetical protein
MGVMDIFKKSEEKASFDSFPDISNYRTYIVLTPLPAKEKR